VQKYIDALRKTGKQLEADFEKSKDIHHSASKGSFRENIVDSIIRPFLPKIYGLSGGECFSKDNQISKQLDLIIYDELYSYKIPYSDNFIQFPCESIYGNIEVKSYLSKGDFLKSVENIASLKKLNRDSTTALNVTPFLEFGLGGGLEFNDTGNKNDYIGIVFAYDSPSIHTIMTYFDLVNVNEKLLPDYFVIYNKKTIICKLKDNYAGFNIKDFTHFIPVNTGEDTLPIFISQLLTMLQSMHLKAADIKTIPIMLLNSKLKDIKSYITNNKEFNKKTE